MKYRILLTILFFFMVCGSLYYLEQNAVPTNQTDNALKTVNETDNSTRMMERNYSNFNNYIRLMTGFLFIILMYLIWQKPISNFYNKVNKANNCNCSDNPNEKCKCK